MIYLFTALYCEASLFIRHFHLKKNPKNIRFQQFYNETDDICLTVTGVGEIAAAAAVSSVCIEHRSSREDLLLNVGICAREAESDGIFLCNKIVEQATGKTFYPDILYRHGFCEEMIVTEMMPYAGGAFDDIVPSSFPDGALHDMEAAAIYQAGSYFFGPHQMIFLKLVSDHGMSEAVSPEQVTCLMEAQKDPLCDFIRQLLDFASEHANREHGLDPEQEALYEKLCADLHCSKVMGDSLRQHLRYFALTGMDVDSVIQKMYGEGMLPCKDKREGKLRFEELKRRLF